MKKNERKEKDDKEKAQDIRNKAMETFGDTRKRKELMEGGNEPKDKKCKRSSSDMISFLREKMEMDNESKLLSLQNAREEREAREQQHKEVILQNQQLQAQQTQTLQVLLQQQQQLIVSLLAKK